MNLSYYKKGRFALTLENSSEIAKIKQLSGFQDDAYRYDKYNDYANALDLWKFAKHELEVNSTFSNQLTISCDVPFLNIGDVVLLNHNNSKIDGRYICMSYSGSFNGATKMCQMKYTLRKGLNTDALLNFYDNQSLCDKPLEVEDKIYGKVVDSFFNAMWNKNFVASSKNLKPNNWAQVGYLKSILPYRQGLFLKANGLINLYSKIKLIDFQFLGGR